LINILKKTKVLYFVASIYKLGRINSAFFLLWKMRVKR
jgi:hypothetical protein